jgi:hypothetical protein
MAQTAGTGYIASPDGRYFQKEPGEGRQQCFHDADFTDEDALAFVIDPGRRCSDSEAAASMPYRFSQSLEYAEYVGQVTAPVNNCRQVVRVEQTSIGVDDNRRKFESSQDFGSPSRAVGNHTLSSKLFDAFLQRHPEHSFLAFHDKYGMAS